LHDRTSIIRRGGSMSLSEIRKRKAPASIHRKKMLEMRSSKGERG